MTSPAAIGTLMRRHGALPIASDIGDCLFTALGLANTADRPGYYATMGLLACRAGLGIRTLPACGRWIPGRRWRLPDDRLGAQQLPALAGTRSSSFPATPAGRCCTQPGIGVQPPRQNGASPNSAAALGGHGERVRMRRELHAALSAAHVHRGRFMIEGDDRARGRLSHTLARYVEGFRPAARQEQQATEAAAPRNRPLFARCTVTLIRS